MALGTPTILEQSGGAAATSHATGTLSPAADTLLVVCCLATTGGSTVTPGVSGLGLTWSQIAVVGASTHCRMYKARTGGSAPTPGAITMTHGTSAIGEWAVVATTGADATTPVVQSANIAIAAGTTGTPTLAGAYAQGANIAIAMLGHNNGNATTTESGWNEIADHSANARTIAVAWRTAADADLSCAFSWTGSVNRGGLIVEIAAAVTTWTGAGTLDGAGAATLAGTLTHPGAMAAAGVGAGALAGTLKHPSAGTLSGVGAAACAGTVSSGVVWEGAATLAGTGAAALAGTLTHPGAGVAAGAGAAALSANLKHPGAGTLSATGAAALAATVIAAPAPPVVAIDLLQYTVTTRITSLRTPRR